MSEIEIHHEHAADPASRRVGILVGVVGILLSVATISSHREHTRAVIDRTEANDQWTYYQAKKTREQASEVGLTLLDALQSDAVKAGAAKDKLAAERDKYDADSKGIQKDAQAKDAATDHAEKRALLFDLSEGLLELGLVLCSLYFLARKSFFPTFGIVAATLGTLIGIAGYLI
jgi:Domain of unknown function (DUF4337)